MKRFIFSLAVGSMVLSLVLVNVAWADSTIGVNMSTTGTLTVNSGSATAIQFQNGSGTNVFIFDTSNKRFGIGATPGTTFEAQGTASASYFLTGNTIQIGGYASVAYSRFGTGATGHGLSANNDLLITGFAEFDKKAYFDATASAAYFFSQNAAQFAGNASVAYSRFGTTTTNHANYISAANDLLISGDVEIRGSASFGGTASVSGVFYMNDGRFRPNANSATAFRFQNAAGTTNVLTIDTTNTRVGVNAGGDVDTTLEVGGTASISDQATFGEDVSVSGRFELTSSAARFGLNAGGFTDTPLEVGGNASVSTLFAITKTVVGSGTASASAYTAEFVSTGTTSVLFGGDSTTLGTCLQFKNTTGQPVYARIFGTTWTLNANECR